MKKVLLFASVVAALSMTSCGGWNDDNKKQLKDNCLIVEEILYEKEDAAKICDCVLGKLVAKFPKADHKDTDILNTMDECEKEGKYTDKLTKELEKSLGSFEESLDTALNTMESAPSIK